MKMCGRVAQLVEQRPFKAWVDGSNPSALTNFNTLSCRLPKWKMRSAFRR